MPDDTRHVVVIIWAALVIFLGAMIVYHSELKPPNIAIGLWLMYMANKLTQYNKYAFWICFILHIGLSGFILKSLGYGLVPSLICYGSLFMLWSERSKFTSTN